MTYKLKKKGIFKDFPNLGEIASQTHRQNNGLVLKNGHRELSVDITHVIHLLKSFT